MIYRSAPFSMTLSDS